MTRFIRFLLLFGISLTCQAAPLPANEVFSFHVSQAASNQINLAIKIKSGYSLYRNRMQISDKENATFKIESVKYPVPSVHSTDKKHAAYRHSVVIPVTLTDLQPGSGRIQFQYQGCSDSGYCYPPQKQWLQIVVADNLTIADVRPVDTKTNTATLPPPAKTGIGDIELLFSQHQHGYVLLIFYGLGILLAFTPCILPMIPVLSGIILGREKHLSTKKAFLVSFCYVAGMAITYAAIGAIVALIGANLQLMMQSTWIIALFSLVFVLLALSMFGFYEMTLPQSWQSVLVTAQRRQQGGNYLGAAVMGSLSTLILSPCVTAPLIGALGYIARSGDVVMGSLALFCLGMGIGTPLLIIGTSAGRYLPRAGQWMNRIKGIFGILLLTVAVILASRILPGIVIMVLWACLFVFSGIWIGAFQTKTSLPNRFIQTVGMFVFSYGFLLLISAAMGSSDPSKPLTDLANRPHQHPSGHMQVVKSPQALYQAMQKRHGKPVFLDFYADWCQSCQTMEKTIFQSASVQTLLTDFNVIKADVTRLDHSQKALLKEFDIIAPPTFVFLDRRGNEIPQLRLYGSQSEKQLISHLNQVLNKQ